jgi:hypothetical protein
MSPMNVLLMRRSNGKDVNNNNNGPYRFQDRMSQMDGRGVERSIPTGIIINR